MNSLSEIELALRRLSRQEKWHIVRWLLGDLEENGQGSGDEHDRTMPAELPNYAARRRRIFGDKILPNIVLNSREEERW